jgi:hypothetical protein
MSAFMPDYNVVHVAATTTVSNVAVPTSGPATFNITNVGSDAVLVGLTQSGAPKGNVVIPSGWPMMLQAQNPERTPGTVYVWVTALTSTANVYISSGFEV